MVLALAMAPVWAADDPGLERMATCKDSWLDWNKNDPAQLKKFVDGFRTDFSPHGNDAYWLPKTKKSIQGLNIAQAYPESIGMGVGFSLTVDAPFDQARNMLEKSLGKKLGKCETGDDMRMCELEIAEQRTVTLMAEDSPKSTQTLVGCYYLYEK
jgi:hypothetical protein